MYQYYPQILSFMDKVEEWNVKLNEFTGSHMDNVFVGALIFGAILLVAFWGINMFNK